MTDRASAALSKGTATADPLIGRVIGGRFRVTSLVARGGMGKVYRAEQAPLGRVCALKVLNPSYAGEHDPEFHKRFFLEASIASKLTHPNTVTIFDYGRTDDDVYYMAMEYLEGHTLHRAIREAGQLPAERAVHIARQICRALREAHSLGVIHRDLKPANIFLVEHGDEADFVKVLDFGLVKVADSKGEDLTQTGMFMGSPKYMSPEQIRGDRIDARADVYALGIILYEMLTGKVPFDRPNSVNILMAHVAEDAPAMLETNPHIQVPPELEETVLRCMAKDPDRRFRSMDEVLLALKRVSAGLPVAPITGLEPTERAPLSGSGGSRPGKATARASSPGPTPGAASARAQAPHSSMRALMPSDSPVGGSPLVLHAPARAGSKGMLVAAVGAALALAGVIGLFAIRPPEPAVVVARQQPSPGVGASAVSPGAGAGAAAGAGAGAGAVTVGLARAPSAQPAEPAPLLVTVHVMSDPDGAAVKEDGVEVCGATPCDVTYRGSDADPAREHRLTISHTGFRTETRTIKASDAALTVKLSALPRAAPPPPTRTEAPPAVPTGYKTDIPY